MWLIASGDGDIAYTRVFGPFDGEAAATAALPADTDDIRWRVVELEAPEAIVHEPEVVDDDPAPLAPVVLAQQVHVNPQLMALLNQYGDIENIPAPNPVVYAHANEEIRQVKRDIANLDFNRGFFTEAEGEQLANILRSFGVNDGSADFATQGSFDADAQMQRGKLIFFEELALRHRPRAGF